MTSTAVARRRFLAAGSAAVLLAATVSAHAGSYEDFFSAIRRDDPRAITRLVQRGFDPNTVDKSGQHGLMLTLADDSFASALALAAAPGVNVDVRNAKDESPLMLAALKGRLDLVKALVEKGADVNKPGWTPLHYAATGLEADQLAVISYLLEHHAYIDAESPGGTTPLMMAAYYGKIDAVTLLLNEGADPLLRNSEKLTAIDMAKRVDRQEVADIIAEAIRRRRPNRGKW